MAAMHRLFWAPLLALALLALGCGDESDGDAATATDASLDAGVSRPSQFEATLVPVYSEDAAVFIAVPHQVSLLDVYSNELVPPVSTTTGPQGQFSIDVPAAATSIYVIGQGPDDGNSSTIDLVVLNVDWAEKGALLRIASRTDMDVSAASAGFSPRPDRASLAGGIFWTSGGAVRGTVGCAKVYVDGEHVPDEDQALRYLGGSATVLPLSEQPETSRLGFFIYENIKVGLHTIRVSLDDGQTFIAEQTFTVSRTRKGAQSPTKGILYSATLKVEASADPTPSRCPPLPGR